MLEGFFRRGVPPQERQPKAQTPVDVSKKEKTGSDLFKPVDGWHDQEGDDFQYSFDVDGFNGWRRRKDGKPVDEDGHMEENVETGEKR
jgi:hypothetical protein